MLLNAEHAQAIHVGHDQAGVVLIEGHMEQARPPHGASEGRHAARRHGRVSVFLHHGTAHVHAEGALWTTEMCAMASSQGRTGGLSGYYLG